MVEPASSLQEQYLAAHCLFPDISDIRNFLMKIWAVYRSGAFGLMPCSLNTYTAVNLVQRLQAEYEADMGCTFDFDKMVNVFYGTHCRHNGIDPTRKGPGDSFNMAAYDVAESSMLPTPVLMITYMDILCGGSMPLPKQGFFGHYDPESDRNKKNAHAKF